MLDEMTLFIRLYEIKSFKKCAEILMIQPSTLSRRIIELEFRLKKQLIIRTSKSFKITEFGEDMYKRFRHLPNLAEVIVSSYHKEQNSNQSGVLNIALGAAISYELIAPMLDEFMVANPNVKLQVNFTVNITKWPSENTSLVLSARCLEGRNLENRFLRSEYFKLYCRTQYVMKYGMPSDPEDLSNHRVLGGVDLDNKQSVDYVLLKNTKTNREYTLDLTNVPLKINNPLHVRKIGLESDYIFWSWDSLCAKDLAEGTILPVLPEWQTFKLDFYLVSKKNPTVLEQSFIDFIYYCMSKSYSRIMIDNAKIDKL